MRQKQSKRAKGTSKSPVVRLRKKRATEPEEALFRGFKASYVGWVKNGLIKKPA